jgi:DNA polymerase-4
MERTILHINVTHFHVAVACLQSPRLGGYPLAVRAPGSRRLLLDISSEAWSAGVCRGMTYEAAKLLCPDLVVLEPVPLLYERVEKALFDQACSLSPLVERAGPGHLFIDLTGTRRLLGGAADIADRLRTRIRDDCRVEPVVGIAANRLVSKIATRVIKPRGLCTIVPGCEEEFMAPLPLTFLPGIEQRQFDKLQQFNLQLIRDLTRIPARQLATAIGPAAFSIHRQARGIDRTPVLGATQAAPTVVESVTLAEQTNDDTLIAAALFNLTSLVCARVRSFGLAIGKVYLGIRYADGASAVRSMAVRPPLSGDLSVYGQCAQLLTKTLTRRVRLTDMSIECSDLTFPYGQLDLFERTGREEQLMGALDAIRGNYGRRAIRFWGRERAA